MSRSSISREKAYLYFSWTLSRIFTSNTSRATRLQTSLSSLTNLQCQITPGLILQHHALVATLFDDISRTAVRPATSVSGEKASVLLLDLQQRLALLRAHVSTFSLASCILISLSYHMCLKFTVRGRHNHGSGTFTASESTCSRALSLFFSTTTHIFSHI